jgi:hypothetical protein
LGTIWVICGRKNRANSLKLVFWKGGYCPIWCSTPEKQPFALVSKVVVTRTNTYYCQRGRPHPSGVLTFETLYGSLAYRVIVTMAISTPAAPIVATDTAATAAAASARLGCDRQGHPSGGCWCARGGSNGKVEAKENRILLIITFKAVKIWLLWFAQSFSCNLF